MEKSLLQNGEIGDFFKSFPIPDIIPTNAHIASPPHPDDTFTTISTPSPTDSKTSPPAPSRKRKRTDSNEGPMPRTVFSRHQLETLESRFREQSFLSKEERQELSQDLRLTERQVMIWFQNRRGRLKKRGPMDKAYNPAKLQEINIRRPYPFLCGVLTNGHRYQQGQPQAFSVYPKEVQTHIHKVVTQLPSNDRATITQLTDMSKIQDNANSENQIQDTNNAGAKGKTVPPPNVNFYDTLKSANSFAYTPQSEQYNFNNLQTAASQYLHCQMDRMQSTAPAYGNVGMKQNQVQESHYSSVTPSCLAESTYSATNASINSSYYSFNQQPNVTYCTANTSPTNSSSIYMNNLYKSQPSVHDNVSSTQSMYSSISSPQYSIDWLRMYPGMCNKQTTMENMYQTYPPSGGSTYQFQGDYNSCSALY